MEVQHPKSHWSACALNLLYLLSLEHERSGLEHGNNKRFGGSGLVLAVSYSAWGRSEKAKHFLFGRTDKDTTVYFRRRVHDIAVKSFKTVYGDKAGKVSLEENKEAIAKTHKRLERFSGNYDEIQCWSEWQDLNRDPLVPNEVRYQTAPHSEIWTYKRGKMASQLKIGGARH